MSATDQAANLSDHFNAKADPEDLERRWKLVRHAMADAGVGGLFIHSHVDGIGGMTRWFADIPTWGGYAVSLVFPLDGPMTLISHGNFDGDQETDPDDHNHFGIGRVMSVPSFASASYCSTYDADLTLRALRDLKIERLGIVGPGYIPYPVLDHIKQSFDGEVIDASALVAPIKAVKSPAEQAVIRDTAAMQDAALEHAFRVAKPGMRESELAAEVQRFARLRGSEGGVYFVGSAPMGQPALLNIHPSRQHRRIESGDQLMFVVENSGAGGYFTHVGRAAVFGKAPRRLLDEHKFVRDAQDYVVDMLRPGADPAQIASAYDDYMLASGRPKETRLLAHGQGVDLVEPPLIRQDESMPLSVGMNIGVHPIYVHEGVFGYTCDNYLIGDDGVERIHSVPRELREL